MVRADARRNTERLRRAALDVFRERGLHAPLDDVAARAGVSIGTVYNRFGSRDGLIDAVMPDLLRRQIAGIGEEVEAASSPWGRVQAQLHGLVEMQVADPALAQSIAQAPPGSELADVCTEAMRGVGAVVDEGVAAGVVRQDAAADDVAALLVANVALLASMGPEATRRLSSVFISGLRA